MIRVLRHDPGWNCCSSHHVETVEQSAGDNAHWMEGLLFPVQGGLLCWTELKQSDIDPLDGYATAWKLVCPGHLPHTEDLCTDTSAEIR